MTAGSRHDFSPLSFTPPSATTIRSPSCWLLYNPAVVALVIVCARDKLGARWPGIFVRNIPIIPPHGHPKGQVTSWASALRPCTT
jgi:hypothetical protein